MQHSLGVAHGGKVKCVHVYKDVKSEESDFDDDEIEIETDYVTGTVMTIFMLHCESHGFQHMFHDGGPASYIQLADSLQVDYILNELIPMPDVTIAELHWDRPYGKMVDVLFTSESMKRPGRFTDVNLVEAHQSTDRTLLVAKQNRNIQKKEMARKAKISDDKNIDSNFDENLRLLQSRQCIF